VQPPQGLNKDPNASAKFITGKVIACPDNAKRLHAMSNKYTVSYVVKRCGYIATTAGTAY
jgi:hypothetical protein